MLAQFTTIDADACADRKFDVPTDAMLTSVPHDSFVVGDVTCTIRLAPGARLVPTPPQVSVDDEMEHDHPADAEATDHDVPEPGSWSVTVTSRAVPVPSLVAVIVNPT